MRSPEQAAKILMDVAAPTALLAATPFAPPALAFECPTHSPAGGIRTHNSGGLSSKPLPIGPHQVVLFTF